MILSSVHFNSLKFKFLSVSVHVPEVLCCHIHLKISIRNLKHHIYLAIRQVFPLLKEDKKNKIMIFLTRQI